MKRSALLLASTLILSSLFSCAAPNTFPGAMGPQSGLNSFSNVAEFPGAPGGLLTLSDQREDTATPKEVDSELNNRPSRGVPKPIQNAPIKYQPPTRGPRDPNNIAATASFAIDSMNRARSWESGYRIGEEALKDLSAEAYIARLGVASSAPSMQWETAFYVAGYSLQHIASGESNTVESTCNLVLKMMNKSKTWEEGSRIGFAALKQIRLTATPGISSFIDTALSSADAARYWEDTYQTLASALQRMKSIKP